MKVVVQSAGVWKNSISGRGQNRRVTFKTIEPHSRKYVYLNMTDYENHGMQTLAQYWLPALKVGNMLNVPLLNDNTVNKFGQYQLIKQSGVEHSEDN